MGAKVFTGSGMRRMIKSTCEDCGVRKSRFVRATTPNSVEAADQQQQGEGFFSDLIGNAHKIVTHPKFHQAVRYGAPLANLAFPGVGSALSAVSQYTGKTHKLSRKLSKFANRTTKKKFMVPLPPIQGRFVKMHPAKRRRRQIEGDGFFGDVGDFFKGAANKVADTAKNVYNSTIGDTGFQNGFKKGFGKTLQTLSPALGLVNLVAPGVGTIGSYAARAAGNQIAGEPGWFGEGIHARKRMLSQVNMIRGGGKLNRFPIRHR